jgi:ComF family protein
MNFFNELLNLFFPNVCCTCGKNLVKNEEMMCFLCRSELPKVNYTDPNKNELKDRFAGKLNIEFAFAALNFYKSGITQRLLHQLKYKNRPEIGAFFGRMLGQQVVNSGIAQMVDLIYPVPLHPKKERRRGYNQSYFIAQGISETTGIAVIANNLQRTKHSESQTGKSRASRWESVKDAFTVRQPEKISARSILLVDDIVTTGATIEACGHQLLEANAKKISVAALAVAK